MPLPKAVRRLTPGRVRDDPRLRAIALAAGVVPPRTMHSEAEAAALVRLSAGRSRVVELGVYEGASAVTLVGALGPETELHLVDPFVDATGWALPAGWGANPTATRRAVQRAGRSGGGPRVVWHLARSQDVGRTWAGGPVDLVFVDGDHSPEGCREDWDVWHPHVRPGGAIAFHDAREGQPGGTGGTGPTAVVDALFRAAEPVAGWRIAEEVDTLVVVSRSA